MGRTACIDVAALPLQLLIRRHPAWRPHPAAVVAADGPQAPVQYTNAAAWRAGVRPGMRYAAALALCRGLRAGTVEDAEIATAVAELTAQLQRFSPAVEAETAEPGVFWVDASGLGRLYGPGAAGGTAWDAVSEAPPAMAPARADEGPDPVDDTAPAKAAARFSPTGAAPDRPALQAWARQIRAALLEDGLVATVVVGFSRFGSYALAKARRGVAVLPSADAERATSHAVPLGRLRLEPQVREQLERLGVTTVGELLALPGGGLHERFGTAVARLHRLAAGELDPPLVAAPMPAPPVRELALDDAEDDRERLLFMLKRLLHPLLADLHAQGQAVAALHLDCILEGHHRHHARLQPAHPTLDPGVLMDLLRLRLDATPPPAPVVLAALRAEPIAALPQVLALFADNPRRDPQAALTALARVRAELGDDAVRTAELHPGHLPEAQFRWVPLDDLPAAAPQALARPPLVRRLHGTPAPLANRPGDAELPPGHRQRGPRMLLSGGWWRREIRRHYQFAEVGGRLSWVFFDARRSCWVRQGTVG